MEIAGVKLVNYTYWKMLTEKIERMILIRNILGIGFIKEESVHIKLERRRIYQLM